MTKLQQAIKLLRHDDAEVRRKAIGYLAKSGEEDAVKALAWAYKNDPDTELRDLARKAGSYAKRQQSNADGTIGGQGLLAHKPKGQEPPQPVDPMFTFDDEVSSGYMASSTSVYDDDDDDFFSFDDDEDSADEYDYNEDYEADTGPIAYDARKAIDRAMDMHIDGDDVEALESLAKAIDIDRRASDDDVARNVANAATGLPGHEVMAALASPFERAQLIETVEMEEGEAGPKKKKRGEAPGWGSVWMDIGIYGLVTITGSIIFMVLLIGRFTPTLQELGTYPEFRSALAESDLTVEDYDLFVDALQASVVFWVIVITVYALFDVVGRFIQGFVYHFVASSMMGGRRPTTSTFSAFIPTQTIFNGIGLGIAILFLFILPTSPAVYIDEAQFSSAVAGPIFMGAGIAVILAIAYPIVLSLRIGNAQEFGFGKGCLTLIIGGVVIGIVNCMFNFVIQAFGSGLAAFAGSM